VTACASQQPKRGTATSDASTQAVSGNPDEMAGNALQALSVSLLDGVDEAFFYLEKAYEERDPILLNLKHNRLVPPKLKADPRFEQLFERVGFPLD